MRLKVMLLAMLSIILSGVIGYADAEITVQYNAETLCFDEKPIIRNDKTLVQMRPIAEAMGLGIEYIESSGEVILSLEETTVVFTTNSDIIKVNGRAMQMIAPAVNHNDYIFVPVRDLAEPFGEIVSYDAETKAVSIETPVIEEAEDEIASEIEEAISAINKMEAERPQENPLSAVKDILSGSGDFTSYYFYQSQPDIALESNGKGYCWVCSYAMLISNLKNEVISPVQVANVNIEAGYAGNYMFHTKIAKVFGCEFVPALPENSPYFESFEDDHRGATKIKFETEQDVIALLKEALLLHPEGILVRYEGYPHTMIAVGFEGDTIYYNDPAVANKEHITFEESCLSHFKLTDLSFIQAMKLVEE